MAIDPGSDKCGLVVLDERDGVLVRGVVPSDLIGPIAAEWAAAHLPHQVLLGSGTSARLIRKRLTNLDVPLRMVREAHTTLRARRRYCEENPPGGLFRFRFLWGLFTPPVPIDDYAALIIAEDYLEESP